VFGQLNEDGNIVYFTPTHGGLVYKFVNSKGKTIKTLALIPRKRLMQWRKMKNFFL